MIEKGKVSTVMDGGKSVTATPYIGGTVTAPLIVPEFLLDCLTVGMPIVYAAFDDNTGIVLARMDGEWNHKVLGTLDVTGIISAADVTAGAVESLASHTHTYERGGSGTDTTSAPT